MTRARFRIVICDDSAAYRAALAAFLEHDDALHVEGSFGSAEELLEELPRLEPDLITLDLEMPGMGGLPAVERIMRDRPIPILVLSAYAGKGSEHAAAALAAGAVEATEKAGLRLSEPDDVWATAMRSRIKRLASLQLNRPVRDGRRSLPPRRAVAAGREARIVAIGASTGGPPALTSVLSRLPADFPIPVVVVQHITPGFGGGLVTLLDRRVPLPVRVAIDRAPVQPGIWFASDDAHLGIDNAMRFTLDRVTRRGAHRPSLDMLFESVAAAAGDLAVGVVLTGMGRDGALGVGAIRAAGGLTIAQDEASSAVFGMPRAAIAAGAELVLPLDEVGPALSSLRAAPAKS